MPVPVELLQNLVAIKSISVPGFERQRLVSTATLLGISRVITLRRMLLPLLIFALVGCMGLFAALRPEAYARYFLAEFQRRAVSRNLKALSFTGWVIFYGCLAVVLALPVPEQVGPLGSSV